VLEDTIKSIIEKIDNTDNKTHVLNEIKETVLQSVSDLSALSEENAASNQEVNASVQEIVSAISDIKSSSDSIKAQSIELIDSVDYFKTEE
jgi:methyl-accepting chemotaxis protein